MINYAEKENSEDEVRQMSNLDIGSRVLVDFKGTLYKATIRKHRVKSDKQEFLIHFDGNKKSNVRWLPVDCIKSPDEPSKDGNDNEDDEDNVDVKYDENNEDDEEVEDDDENNKDDDDNVNDDDVGTFSNEVEGGVPSAPHSTWIKRLHILNQTPSYRSDVEKDEIDLLMKKTTPDEV